MSLKELFKVNKDEVFGLDIGTNAVKMVQICKEGSSYVLTAAGICEIPAVTGNNKQENGQNVVRAIRDCLQMSGTDARFATCGVCGPEVAVRRFQFPSLPAGELEGAILLEASQVCPFNINEGSVDYQIAPNGDDENVSGVLVATTSKLIARKQGLAKSASLDCALMDVDGLALLNCFNTFTSKTNTKEVKNRHKPLAVGRTFAVLNVGYSFSTLAIISENGLPFVRDIPYGGRGIVEHIASDRSISSERVNRYLKDISSSRDGQFEISDAFGNASRRLIDDVSETLRFYSAQEKSSLIDKLFVCGGFSLVGGFVEFLDEQLPTGAVLWNPFEAIRCRADEQCELLVRQKGSVLAVAAGLALRTI